jgi:hypothetical protein
LFGLVGSAVLFSMMAVSGVFVGYFWGQTHHWSFREWLEKEPAPEEEAEDEEGPETTEAGRELL